MPARNLRLPNQRLLERGFAHELVHNRIVKTGQPFISQGRNIGIAVFAHVLFSLPGKLITLFWELLIIMLKPVSTS